MVKIYLDLELDLKKQQHMNENTVCNTVKYILVICQKLN